MKRKITLLTLLFLQTFFIRAQNYMTNGDFETNTGYPTGAAQYALATGWTNCSGTGSPDYAHTSGTGLAALPNNYFGIVSPHGGNAVMGVILWHSTTPSYREYISHMLSSPLVIGNTYNVSFYLTNGGSSGNYGGYGVDQVSIAFSTSPLVQTGSSPVNFNPQYVMSSVFFDSTWQMVSFLFTADSAYNYLTFGNFKTDANTNTQFFRTEGIQAGYYFIDDIEVKDSVSSLPVIAFSSSDSSFCGKQCIDFTDLSTNNPTSWQWFFPGADSTSSQMQNPAGICYSSYGSFDVTLIACNAGGCDTLIMSGFINEFPNPPVPAVTGNFDTLFCSQAYSYQWYFNSTVIPGATNQYYVFQQPGNYFVIVTDSNGCATSSAAIFTGMHEAVYGNAYIDVIPNPSDGNFILYGAPMNSVIKIYDVAGHLIYSDIIITPQKLLQLEAADGIYFLEMMSRDKIIRKKIVLKN